MRSLILAVALTAAASSAQAATFIFHAGSFGPPAGYTLVNTFDDAAAQAAVSGSNFVFPTGTTGGQYVAPTGDTTPYLAVLGGGSATVGFASPVKSFSFDYSTVDTYNTLTLSYAGGGTQSFSGSDILGGLPTGVTSGSIVVNGNGQTISSITLGTTSNSFEVDNLATSAGLGTVPEPAAWGLMLVGFGFVGAAARQRRQAVAA